MLRPVLVAVSVLAGALAVVASPPAGMQANSSVGNCSRVFSALPDLTGAWSPLADPASPPWELEAGPGLKTLAATWHGSPPHSALVGSFHGTVSEVGGAEVYSGKFAVTEGTVHNGGTMTIKIVSLNEYLMSYRSSNSSGTDQQFDRAVARITFNAHASGAPADRRPNVSATTVDGSGGVVAGEIADPSRPLCGTAKGHFRITTHYKAGSKLSSSTIKLEPTGKTYGEVVQGSGGYDAISVYTMSIVSSDDPLCRSGTASFIGDAASETVTLDLHCQTPKAATYRLSFPNSGSTHADVTIIAPH